MRCWRFGFIAADLTKHFENRWGWPTISGQHLLHHTARLQYTFCQQKWMSCWHLFYQPLLVISKLSLTAASYHCCPTFTNWFPQEILHDFRKISLQTMEWVLILFFELPAISFSAEARAQHISCLTSGNWVSSLICFQWNLHRAWHWHFLNK